MQILKQKKLMAIQIKSVNNSPTMGVEYVMVKVRRTAAVLVLLVCVVVVRDVHVAVLKLFLLPPDNFKII